MNRRTKVLTIVSALAAVMVIYGAVTGYAAVLTSNPTPATTTIAAQPAAALQAAAATTGVPVAADDTYTITDGAALTVAAPGVLANDSGATLRAVPVTGPAQGSLTLSPAGGFTYDPLGTTGTVTFTYKATDGAALSNVAVVTITVSTAGSGGVPVGTPAAPDGAALYASACAACHGKGGFTPALDNAGVVTKLTTGTMSSYAASFTAAEIQAIADFLVPPPAPTPTPTTTTTLPPTPTTPPATPPATVDGAAVFAATCAGCHSQSNLASRGLTNADLVTVMTTGLMAPQASSLSAAEIQAVADFIVPPAGGGTTPPPSGGGGTNPPSTPPPPATPVTGGEAAYAAYCAACHGADGTGTAMGPDIVGESSSEIFKVVRKGDGTMPAFSSAMLSDATLAEIVDYMATFAPGAGHGDDDDHESDDHDKSKSDDHDDDGDKSDDHGSKVVSTDGASVYTSYCAACHGADGTGTAMGPDIVGESSSEIFKVVRKGDGTMPAFSYAMLSDSDLAALADYIASWGGSEDDHKSKDKGHDDEDDD